MGRAVFILIIASFILLITPVCVVSYAQEEVIETDTLIGSENTSTDSAPITKNVNYELPYPGMLPDNPFYFLKAIRDNIIKMLINDDLKRAKFSLLNAEKRMFAGKLLVDKGKDELAIETISKSNNYLIDTVNAINKYSKSHPKSTDIKPFMLQVDMAILKHQEIMSNLKQHIDKDKVSTFANEQMRLTSVQENVTNLLLKN